MDPGRVAAAGRLARMLVRHPGWLPVPGSFSRLFIRHFGNIGVDGLAVGCRRYPRGTEEVDADALAVIHAWISSLDGRRARMTVG